MTEGGGTGQWVGLASVRDVEDAITALRPVPEAITNTSDALNAVSAGPNQPHYATELLALVPALRQRLTTLGAQATAGLANPTYTASCQTYLRMLGDAEAQLQQTEASLNRIVNGVQGVRTGAGRMNGIATDLAALMNEIMVWMDNFRTNVIEATLDLPPDVNVEELDPLHVPIIQPMPPVPPAPQVDVVGPMRVDQRTLVTADTAAAAVDSANVNVAQVSHVTAANVAPVSAGVAGMAVAGLAAAFFENKDVPDAKPAEAGDKPLSPGEGVVTVTPGGAIEGYTERQTDLARQIIERIQERGLPKEAAEIAISTAIVESGLKMYANENIPASLSIPHDAVGRDHASVGLFQQQTGNAWTSSPGISTMGSPDGWGKPAELMDVKISTDKFLDRLLAIPGWDQGDPGAMAQRVQGSAFPDRYGQEMDEARAIVNALWGR